MNNLTDMSRNLNIYLNNVIPIHFAYVIIFFKQIRTIYY